MAFVKKTLEYLKKAFPPLLVAAIFPAIVLGLFCNPFPAITFLPTYIKSRSGGFADILWMLFSRRGFLHIYPYLLIIVLMVFSLSYSLSLMEKHFKTGKLVLLNPVRSINNSMLSVLKIMPIAIAVVFVVLFLQTGLVSLIRHVVSGANAYPKVLDSVWTGIISILLYLVQVTLLVFMGVWAVIIQIFGFSFQDAFVEAIRTVSKKWFSFITGLLVPLTALLVPLFVLRFFDGLSAAKKILNITTYAVILVYYCAYIMVSVYSLTGLERRDQKSVVPKEMKYVS